MAETVKDVATRLDRLSEPKAELAKIHARLDVSFQRQQVLLDKHEGLHDSHRDVLSRFRLYERLGAILLVAILSTLAWSIRTLTRLEDQVGTQALALAQLERQIEAQSRALARLENQIETHSRVIAELQAD
jgi:hypothetical protein